ncbi:amino acid ABC transporter substrate-binding protein [Desulforhopalus sp. 52FAK]
MSFWNLRLLISILMIFQGASVYATDTPFLIGATVSLEGKYVETSRMIRKSYELWESQINEKGGLLGRKVKLLLYDDKSNPDLAKKLYEKLIVDDEVELILSPYGTPLTLAASEVTEKHGKVMIACASAAMKPWERGYRHLFGIYALADRYFISFHDVIARKGYKTVAIIYEDSVFNIAIGTAAAKWAKRFGLEVVYMQSFTDGESQFPTIINEIGAINPDGVIFSAYPPDSYAFLEELKKNSFRPNALGMTIVPTYPHFYEKVGPFANGIFGTSQWEPDERIPFPGTIKFIADFKQFVGQEPSYHAGSAYAACKILEQAVTQFNEVNHEKIREYVYSLDTMTVIGRFKVDQSGRQIGHNPLLIQWQEGKKEIVYPRKMKTKEPIFNHTIQ